ncbi:hypothetical protein [Algibacter mikhailovii]|uniref:hypothetical protein n=1 Tax=Algibacter mikhailovii TaxID=425498 RepID=UPI00249462FF|nr:hypothetical protein [Algibacter mikhailovii]
MRAKFEEKTFESYFNNELDRRSKIYFPLGQVQEGSLGFDASSFSRNRRLWRELGHPFWFHPHFDGLELRDIADEMEHYLGVELDNVPEMKANLLFQYKRPEYITVSTGKEWSHWNEPYFRYDIYKEQQDLLMHIHTTFNSKVLVIYASPSTTDVNELVKVRKDILNHSNFKNAVDLQGHKRNTYTQSGTHSVACSEPQKIENINILRLLENIKVENNNKTENLNNREFVIQFSSKMRGIISEYPYLKESFNELNDYYSKIEQYKLYHSFLIMNNYRQLTGNQWLIKI